MTDHCSLQVPRDIVQSACKSVVRLEGQHLLTKEKDGSHNGNQVQRQRQDVPVPQTPRHRDHMISILSFISPLPSPPRTPQGLRLPHIPIPAPVCARSPQSRHATHLAIPSALINHFPVTGLMIALPSLVTLLPPLVEGEIMRPFWTREV